MSDELKEEIIRAAHLMLLADERVTGEERERLKAIARALRISEGELNGIVAAAEADFR